MEQKVHAYNILEYVALFREKKIIMKNHGSITISLKIRYHHSFTFPVNSLNLPPDPITQSFLYTVCMMILQT